MSVTLDQVIAALRDVLDPELGMSIVDLGLVYEVAISAGRVDITMTLTAQGCPLHGAMVEWVRQATARIPGVEQVMVNLVFAPRWTPDRIGQGALLVPGTHGTGGNSGGCLSQTHRADAGEAPWNPNHA